MEISREEQFAPTLTGLGTGRPAIFAPNPTASRHGLCTRPDACASTDGTTTVGAYVFDTVEVSSRCRYRGGFRYDRYDTEFRSLDAAGLHDHRSRRPTA